MATHALPRVDAPLRRSRGVPRRAVWIALLALGAAIAAAVAWLHGVPTSRTPGREIVTPEMAALPADVMPPVERRTDMPPPAPGTDTSIASTPRPLILTGTHIAARPADSLAFLGIDPKYPQTYAVGALLANGTRLKSIERDHVLLERDGRSERLDIGGTFTAATTSSATALRSIGAAPLAVTMPTPASEPVTEFLRVSPVFDDTGTFEGYRLNAARSSSLFSQWGLQPDDLLVAIDGAPLTDVDTAAGLLGMVGNGLRLSATVLREGVAVQVVLDGADIETARERARQPPALSVEPSMAMQ